MDLNLNKEQKMLQKSAHDFLVKECPKTRVREIEKSDDGYSRELWKKMGALGWMGLIIPEEYGGSGGTFLDLVVLLETMGYHLCPGPFFSTVMLGGLPILLAGDEGQKKSLLPGVADASRIMTLALTEPSAGYGADAIRVAARNNKDGYEINGVKLFVPYAHVADSLLCAARTDENVAPENGVTLFLLDRQQPEIACNLLKTLGGDRQCEVVFNELRVTDKDIVGGLNKGWSIVEAALEKAAVALGAEMIGGAQAVMEMAIRYAKERVQFGRSIGSFQAIQHRFADMWADITGSRDLLYRTAWKLTENLPAAKDIAMTKARVGKTYRRVTTSGHQIFGAIGFTEEHDMHLYHKRSIVMDLTFGNAEHHYRKMTDNLFSDLGG